VAREPHRYVRAMSARDSCLMAIDNSTIDTAPRAEPDDVPDAVIWAVNAALASERYDLVDELTAQYELETTAS
jgi:hypothetical protein